MNKKIPMAEAKAFLSRFGAVDLGPGRGNGGLVRSWHTFGMGDLKLRLTTKVIGGEVWSTEYLVFDDDNSNSRVGSQYFGTLDRAVRCLLNGRFRRVFLRNVMGLSMMIEAEILHVGKDYRKKAFALMRSFADPFGCTVEAMSQKYEHIRWEKAAHAASDEPEFVAMVESLIAGDCPENAFVDKMIDVAGDHAEECLRHAGKVLSGL